MSFSNDYVINTSWVSTVGARRAPSPRSGRAAAARCGGAAAAGGGAARRRRWRGRRRSRGGRRSRAGAPRSHPIARPACARARRGARRRRRPSTAASCHARSSLSRLVSSGVVEVDTGLSTCCCSRLKSAYVRMPSPDESNSAIRLGIVMSMSFRSAFAFFLLWRNSRSSSSSIVPELLASTWQGGAAGGEAGRRCGMRGMRGMRV